MADADPNYERFIDVMLLKFSIIMYIRIFANFCEIIDQNLKVIFWFLK